MILTSKNNPLVKETVALKDKKGRKESSLFLVEGAKMVAECQKSSMAIERIIVSERFQGSVPENAVVVSEDVFRLLSDEQTPQGILCRVKIPSREFVKPSESCLLLDGVSDPGNMGAIIRTANAAGYKKLYCIGCVDPYSPKSVRASMSGIFFTELYMGTKEEILPLFDETPILSADMDGENIFSFTPPKKFALAIGNEANGISREVFEKSQYKIRIPMEQTQESLNAAVAAGIAMYQLKQEKFKSN
ncbi:MAG: RNA methyltransferase [Clostridia bacterium]|nr:RNA methyltransferase [Clostridia bacterium]